MNVITQQVERVSSSPEMLLCTNYSCKQALVFDDTLFTTTSTPDNDSSLSSSSPGRDTIYLEIALNRQDAAWIITSAVIIFNMQTLRDVAQKSNRSWMSVYKELITHENVHRSFNQLDSAVRAEVISQASSYFQRMLDHFDDLSADQKRLFEDLAKNLGMTVSQLRGLKNFTHREANEMVEDVFGVLPC